MLLETDLLEKNELFLTVTKKCNLKCQMCDIPKRFANSECEMPLDTIKKIFDDAAKLKFKRISISGGEPLTRKDIFDIISYASGNNIKTTLCTNGTLINEHIAKRLKLCGLNTACISIDGPEDVHDKIRGKGTFRKSIKAIKLLRNEGIRVAMPTVIMKQNYSQLTQLVKLCNELHVNSKPFQPFYEGFLDNQSKAKKFKLNQSEINKLKREIENVIKLCKKYEIDTNPLEYLNKLPNFFLKTKTESIKSCLIPFQTCAIDANGWLLACWRMKDGTIGNLKKEALFDLWNSKKYEAIRELASNGKCWTPNCVLSCYDNMYSKEGKNNFESDKMKKKYLNPMYEEFFKTNRPQKIHNDAYLTYLKDFFNFLQKKIESEDWQKDETFEPCDENIKTYNFILHNVVGNSILDVSAGTGLLPLLIKNNFQEMKVVASGVDFLDSARKLATIEGLDVSFINLDISKDDVNKYGVYDTVICSHILEHLKGSSNKRAVKNLFQLTNKRLIVLVQANKKIKQTFNLFLSFLKKGQIERLAFIENGMIIDKKFGKGYVNDDIPKYINKINQCNNNCIFCHSKFREFSVEKENVRTLENKELPNPLIIYLTRRCNLSCIQCGARNNQRLELNTPKIKKVLSDVKSWTGDRKIYFTGGEPLIRKDIIELLRYCKKLSLKIAITTNATLIDKKLAREITKNVSSISISIDGLEKTHDKIRGKGNYKRALKAIKFLRMCDKNFPIEIASILHKNNLDEAERMVRWVKKNNLKIHFQGIYASETPKGKKLLPKTKEGINQTIKKIIQMKMSGYPITNSMDYLIKLKKYFNHNIHPEEINCNPYALRIDINGNAVICWDNKIIGNVLEKNMEELWRSKIAHKVRDDVKRCKKDCFILLCNGIEAEKIILPCNIDGRKDFFDIVKIIRMWEFPKIVLNTNGRMFFYKDFCKKVSELGIDRYNVYLCGHDSETHDAITKISGSFKQTIEGIRNLKSMEQSVHVIVIINKKNYKTAFETKTLLNGLGINDDKIQFESIQSLKRGV